MSENHEKFLVPRDVDAPIPIFQWEIPEIIISILFVGIGIIMGMMHIGLLAGGLILYIAKKFKAGRKRGQVQHFLWRVGLTLDKPLKLFGPHPLKLEFIP